MNPSKQIDKQTADLADWRGKIFVQLRKIILKADPKITEEWKWNTAVWACNGLVCAVGAFKDHVKINFFQGAKLKDPNKLINSGLDSKSHRAIDFYEGDKINETTLKELIRSAVAYNSISRK